MPEQQAERSEWRGGVEAVAEGRADDPNSDRALVAHIEANIARHGLNDTTRGLTVGVIRGPQFAGPRHDDHYAEAIARQVRERGGDTMHTADGASFAVGVIGAEGRTGDTAAAPHAPRWSDQHADGAQLVAAQHEIGELKERLARLEAIAAVTESDRRAEGVQMVDVGHPELDSMVLSDVHAEVAEVKPSRKAAAAKEE